MGMVFQMCKFREWEWERPCGNGRDWEYRKPFPHISTVDDYECFKRLLKHISPIKAAASGDFLPIGTGYIKFTLLLLLLLRLPK